MTVDRRLGRRCACWLVLSGALLGALGCESEQCDLNITLGGAIEWVWTWKEQGACKVDTDALLYDSFDRGASIRFPHGDIAFFEFTVPALDVGTYFADSVIYSQGGQIWDAGASTICSVAIGTHEVVDWVQNDHHRVVGTLVCNGPLDEIGGNSELTVSNVTFSVYAPEGY